MQFFLSSQYGRTLSCNAVEKIYVNTMTAYISSARYYNYFFFCSFTYFLFNFFQQKQKKMPLSFHQLRSCKISTISFDGGSHSTLYYNIHNSFKALSFYRSKMILDHPNCFGLVQIVFGRVRIVLVGSKSFWSGSDNTFLD